ncbi:hypothetical protein niasHT_008106 [Heterodera trifolii]|uniref:RING-type domain-containing protein n=1 Tax=Heterodera trifolii TaxID=157864 RepID=A0ABD2M027_9BILA
MKETNSNESADICITDQPDNERREIAELFPNMDLTEVFAEYGHLSSEAIIGLILEKRHQIPLKGRNCHRLMLKACSFFVGLSVWWPRWLGGRVRKLLSSFGARVTGIPIDSLLEQPETESGDHPRRQSVKECMECSVCWETTTVDELCFCDGTTMTATSSSSAKLSTETHAFCRLCLERHARAAVEEMPLAKGGLGLRCMAADCNNPITLQELQVFVPSSTVKKLEERCAELSVVQANLKFMERCRSCNCAVELGASPNVLMVFNCPDCRLKFCRLCDEPWQDEHKGVSCEQFAKKQNRERLLEKRLSEAVVHCCAKCKMSFVKHDGCNKVTCPCGATHCYICRQNNITYAHFCACLQEKATKHPFKCAKCGKSCLLWQSSVTVEKQQMDNIRKEMVEEEKREKAKQKRPTTGNTPNANKKKLADEKKKAVHRWLKNRNA